MSATASQQSPLGDIRVEKSDAPFAAGDVLRGSFCVSAEHAGDARSAEVSVLWYTAGKGDEDFGVHYFQRYTAEGPDAVELSRRREFRTLLPENPLSYDGVIVKVCWCARLRLFMPRGRQQVLEAGFQLGGVAPAQVMTALGQEDDQQEEAD